VDVRIFNKPTTRPHRRMGVALVSAPLGADVKALVVQARAVAAKVTVDGA
jgi:phosphoribosylglycinamide formyltransferase 2